MTFFHTGDIVRVPPLGTRRGTILQRSDQIEDGYIVAWHGTNLWTHEISTALRCVKAAARPQRKPAAAQGELFAVPPLRKVS